MVYKVYFQFFVFALLGVDNSTVVPPAPSMDSNSISNSNASMAMAPPPPPSMAAPLNANKTAPQTKQRNANTQTNATRTTNATQTTHRQKRKQLKTHDANKIGEAGQSKSE